MPTHFSLFFFPPFLFFKVFFYELVLHPTCEDKTSWQVPSQRVSPFPRLSACLATSHQILASHSHTQRLPLRNAAVFRHDAVPQTGALRQLIL